MGIQQPLHFRFSKETIEDIFHFYLLSSISIDKMMAASQLSIIIPILKLCMNEADSVASMAIILVQQGNAPVTVLVFC